MHMSLLTAVYVSLYMSHMWPYLRLSAHVAADCWDCLSAPATLTRESKD